MVQLRRTKDLASFFFVIPQHKLVYLKLRFAIYRYTIKPLGFFGSSERLLTMTLGTPAFTNTTPVTGKRQDAHRRSAMVARDMTTLWAPRPTVLPQLEEGKKLWLPWGQRPASHLIYTVAPMKVNKPSGKSQESEYPQILLCFRLSAE